jgi:predicted nuclease of predicted toxin-antitoxin system
MLKINDYCIVTFDGDFYDLGLVKGSSPKVIWLRLGNTSTQNIENVLRKNFDLIKTFLTDPNYKDIGCLEINN